MSISQQVNSFIEEQKAEWPQAADNYAALSGVEVKEIAMPGMTFKVQFNPARIVSSAAKVDAASLKARKCFLCAENRPAVQRGIAYRGRYTVLINPFPIFPRHLTVPDTSHTDQLIAGRVADMIRLASDLEGYTVFYNGPRCGASAPDHMHFQAGNSDFLTIWSALDDDAMSPVTAQGRSTLSLAEGLPMPVFVIDAATPDEGEALFGRLYAALPVPEGETEPMMNILARSADGRVRVAVIPRKRHRPSFYGTEGDGCMLISPASVDMGGVFITPRREDFDSFGADTVRRLFDELCPSAAEAETIAETIRKQ